MRQSLPLKQRLPVFILLLLIALTAIYPIYFICTTALRTNTDYLKNPYGFSRLTTEAFSVLFENYDLLLVFRNSLIVVLCGVVIAILCSSLAAFSITKLPLPGRKAFSSLFISLMLIPSQVLIIPMYLVLSHVGLVDSFPGIILVYAATNIAFDVFFLTAIFRTIPDTILEAARVDGAGFFRVMFMIAVPSARTGLITLMVLNFLSMWNELLYGYILLPSETKMLLTPKMASIGDALSASNQPVLSAGLVVTALPPLILLVFMSKYLVRGLNAGAVK